MSTSPALQHPWIALLGAESTGKSTLAPQLAAALYQLSGTPWASVDEHLRTWVAAQGRNPERHEQYALAAAQSAQISAARQRHAVVADTTAAMTAAYSEAIFGDLSLWPAALAQLQSAHAVLLMGMDLPWVPDAQRDGAHMQKRVDALLRERLSQAGVGFSVVYGSGAARLEQAVQHIQFAIKSIAACADSTYQNGNFSYKNQKLKSKSPVAWGCEKCSDPECEHRLFVGLVALSGAQ